MKKKNSKKFIIIAIIILIIVIVGGTYAYYSLSLFDDLETSTITNGLDYYINYTQGQDINAATLDSSSNYLGGVNTAVEFWKKDDTYTIYGHIYLDVQALGSNLQSSNALKYTVVSSADGVVSEGIINSTGKQEILTNTPLSTNKIEYKVYVWLDNSVELPLDLTGETFSAKISCEATMK